MAARRRLEKSMHILINRILSFYGFSCMQNQTLVLFSSFIVLESYNARWPPDATLKAILKTSCVLLIFIEYVEYIVICLFFLICIFLKELFFNFDFRRPPYSILKNWNFFY